MSVETPSADDLPKKWRDANGHTNLPKVDTIGEKYVRSEYDRCLLPRAAAGGKIHLPEEDDKDCKTPKCDMKETTWKNKPFNVYPIGTKGTCRRCFSEEYNDAKKREYNNES